MTKIYPVELDLGVLGEFTCDVHCLHCSIIRVEVPFGKVTVNVLEFLETDQRIEIVDKILLAKSEGLLEWKDLSR